MMLDKSYFPALILLAFSVEPSCAHRQSAQKADAGSAEAVGAAIPVPPIPMTRSGLASFAPVVKQVMPSVVSISSTRVVKAPAPMIPFDDPLFRQFFGPGFDTPRDFKERGLGSGVILKDGVVVTNSHVVDGADEIKVTTFDKREFDAKLVGADAQSDLAVLRLEGKPNGLAPTEFGDSTGLELGDVVLAVGYPFGVGETVTMGIVSGLGRSNLGIEEYEDFIQTDAAINPGNSGGALVDSSGRLIGINTAILSRTGGNLGIGFAIPSEMAKPIVKALLEHGKVVRGYLGVSIQDITRDLAQALKLPNVTGVLVSAVNPDTPAASAGLQRGDVILKINGQEMRSSGQLRNLIAAAGAKAKVNVEVWRGGKTMVLPVELAELPASARAEPDGAPYGGGSVGEVSGITVQPLNLELRRKFDIPPSVTSGLVITDVRRDSPAGMAGLRPGDVVLEINQKPVNTVEQFRTQWKESGDRVLLLVQRGAATIFLVVSK